MKKFTYLIIGFLLASPIYAREALGITIDTFRDEVYRPENLPGTRATDAPVETKINEILDFATNLVLYASGSVAVFFLVLGAVRYITAYGDQKRLDEAKKTIKYAVIGLLAVILSFAIVTNVIDLIFRSTL